MFINVSRCSDCLYTIYSGGIPTIFSNQWKRRNPGIESEVSHRFPIHPYFLAIRQRQIFSLHTENFISRRACCSTTASASIYFNILTSSRFFQRFVPVPYTIRLYTNFIKLRAERKREKRETRHALPSFHRVIIDLLGLARISSSYKLLRASLIL